MGTLARYPAYSDRRKAIIRAIANGDCTINEMKYLWHLQFDAYFVGDVEEARLIASSFCLETAVSRQFNVSSAEARDAIKEAAFRKKHGWL